jgi:hypothetical protein
MAQIVVTVLKDAKRYSGDVQRKAREISGKFYREALLKFKDKAQRIHPDKALRLARKEVSSVDHIIRSNISDAAAHEIEKNGGLGAIGYDLAKGRRFDAVLEN